MVPQQGRRQDLGPEEAQKIMSDSSSSTNGHSSSTSDDPEPSQKSRGLVITLLALAILIPLVTISPWILSAALIFACGIYVAFEFALVQISLRELEREAAQNLPGSAQLLKMKRELNTMLAACQFGITLTSLGLTLALEPAIAKALTELPFYEGSILARSGVSHGLAMALGAFMHVTFGELIPKGLALVIPKKVLHTTANFMRIFRFLSIPFIKTCNSIANYVVRLLTGKDPDKDTHHGDNVEIGEALLMAHDQGRIAGRQLNIMKNVLQFTDLTVREVMTPARMVVSLDASRSWDENYAIAQEHGYSRFPVTSSNPHEILGYVRRDALLNAIITGEKDLEKLLLPIERRPETAPLQALNLFRGAPLVAIFDEHDSFSGLLTAEDVIEQILGEIYDESDELENLPVEYEDDGTIHMDGLLLLQTAGETLGLHELDKYQDVDTIGGLILKLLAREPKHGDRVEVENWTAIVDDVQGFRINSLIFEPRSPENGEAENSDYIEQEEMQA